MTLPKLENWDSTRTGLHQAAQVVAAFRKLDAAPLPNYLHLALQVVPEGVSSGPLAFGGDLILDFARRAIRYERSGHETETVPLAGHTQITLTDALTDLLTAVGHSVQPDRSKLTGGETFDIQPSTAAEYAGALFSFYTAMSRFRDRVDGPKSPIALWPHNFDFSFLRFGNPEHSENGLHAAFGFEPRSPGLERPYFYAYVRPSPADITRAMLPKPAYWYTEGWTGAVLQYDDITGMTDHEAFIENTFYAIYTAIKPYLA
jgi:hypothetical protein